MKGRALIIELNPPKTISSPFEGQLSFDDVTKENLLGDYVIQIDKGMTIDDLKVGDLVNLVLKDCEITSIRNINIDE